MPETVPIRPADLLIDEENPRISEPNAGQHRAHQALAQHQQRKLQMLARDIVQHGINPSELPIVMALKDDLNRFIVIEGNRRLAALKALENPDSLVGAVGSAVLSDFRRLSREYHKNPAETVPCVVVKNREEARHWIQLKHTGENEGAGIVPWGSDESARFRARSGAMEIHQQALNFLEKRGSLTPSERRMVPTTSLKRLLETPEVRAKLGLDFQRGELSILADPDVVAKALLYITNDLTTGPTKVADIYTRDKRLQYVSNLPPSIIVKPAVPIGQGMPLGYSSGRRAGKLTGPVRASKPRDKLIPRDCILNVTDKRIRKIEDELRHLSIENFANAVSVLFRVFIELSADDYIDRNGITTTSVDKGLSNKLQAVTADLITRKKLTKQQAKTVRKACEMDSFLAASLTLMHQYVHNQHIFPLPSDLRAAWDSLQSFVAAIWAL